MSSTWQGAKLSLSIFGQSHGEAIGMTLDGLPAGEAVDRAELARFLARRAPGQNAWSTKRRETDEAEFLAGLVNDSSCGAPLAAIIRNTNTRSGDYSGLLDVPRPGHADFAAQMKYGGFQDVRGGGHFSGRLTAPLCIAGGICLQSLRRRGIEIAAHLAAVGGVYDQAPDPAKPDMETLKALGQKDFPALNETAAADMQAAIEAARRAGDSVGGLIGCYVTGLPAGLGEPMFDGMENRLAQMLFGIPAVKGVEFGAGFAAAARRGSENNDPFYWDGDAVKTRSNHHGGILGGISSAMPLWFRVAVKPTPSISMPQRSVSLSQRVDTELVIKGRHDPCIAPRAVPCVEAVAALVILDALLEREGQHKEWNA